MNINGRYLITAFLEGACVMAVELISAKLIAPYFGTSLYVWAAVLGVTMMGLAGGYFAGGRIADKHPKEKTLAVLLSLIGLLVILTPFSSDWIMSATLGIGLRPGILISTLVFLFPPLILLGMISPLIIRLSTKKAEHAGKMAGYVFAISTVGGILATFILGFWGIPSWGLKKPLIIAGMIMLLPAAWSFLTTKHKSGAAVLLLLLSAFWLLPAARMKPPFDEHKLIYSEEGMYGNMAVTEWEYKGDTVRSLFLNNYQQTIIDRDTRYSLNTYVHRMATLAGITPPGSEVLLLGTGGGSLAEELLRLDLRVTGCEIDKRILDAAKKWLHPELKNANLVADDARHFIHGLEGMYELIIFDVFYGESAPGHVFTTEAIGEVKDHLSPRGMIMAYFPGPLEGEEGMPAQMLMNTLKEHYFFVSVLADPYPSGGRIFIATRKPFDYNSYVPIRQNECCRLHNIPVHQPVTADLHFETEAVFRDEFPLLDNMWMEKMIQLRETPEKR